MTEEEIKSTLVNAVGAIESAFSLLRAIDGREEEVKKGLEKIRLRTEELAKDKSEVLRLSNEQSGIFDKSQKMMEIAEKIKLDTDIQREDIKKQKLAIQKREDSLIDLEARAKELETLEKKIFARESDIEDREIVIEKDKVSLRQKQEGLEIKEIAIEKRAANLQKMIDSYK